MKSPAPPSPKARHSGAQGPGRRSGSSLGSRIGHSSSDVQSGLIALASDKKKLKSKSFDDENDFELFEEFFDDSDTDSEAESLESLDAEEVQGGTDLERAYVYLQRQKRRMQEAKNHHEQAEEMRFGLYIDEKEYRVLKRELLEKKALQKYLCLDLVAGMMVVLNAVFLGLTTENVLGETSLAVTTINTVFFVFFFGELMFRYYASHLPFKEFVQDPWVVLDSTCILVSFFDLMLVLATTQKSGVALMATLRLLRLARVMRLIRLMSMFDGLWQLVSGLIGGFKPVIWSVLMLTIFCTLFGLLVFESSVYWQEDGVPDSVRCAGWTTLLESLLSMAQVATFDGGDLMRTYTIECTSPAMLLFFVPVVSIASLGILNLIVGVLLMATIKESKQDDSWQAFAKKLLGHKALRELRKVLTEHCSQEEDVVFHDGSPMVSRMKMLYLLNEQGDTVIKPATAAGAGSRDGLDMVDDVVLGHVEEVEVFQEKVGAEATESHNTRQRRHLAELAQRLFGRPASERPVQLGEARNVADFFDVASVTSDDINEIYDAAKEVWGSEQPMSINDFASGVIWNHTKVHPLDVAEMMSLLSELHARVRTKLMLISEVSMQVQAASYAMMPLLNKANMRSEELSGVPPPGDMRQNRNRLQQLQQEQQAKATELSSAAELLRKRGQEIQHRHDLAEQRARAWLKFDLCFSCVVLSNALVLGVELGFSTNAIRDILNPYFSTADMVWFILEFCFYCIYVAEIGLRVIYEWQMLVMCDFRTIFVILPRRLRNLTRANLVSIVRFLPTMFDSEHWSFMFDLFIVSVSTVDNLVLRFVKGGDIYTRTLRIVGIFRLLRFVRLAHLIPSLRVLAKGVAVNAKLIFWTLILLLVFLYMCAIAMVDLFGKEHPDPDVRKAWGTITDSMLSLMLMATFNEWGHRIDVLGRHTSWAYPFGIGYMMITAVGIMNLITGAMVQAAFSIMLDESKSQTGLMMRAFAAEFTAAAEAVRERRLAQLEVDRLRVQEVIEGIVYQAKNSGTSSSKTYASEGGDEIARAPSMGSVSSLVSGEQAPTEPEAPEEEEEEGALAIRFGGSSTQNVCRVTACLWVSAIEVAVQIRTFEDSAPEPARQPELSRLIWEGGGCGAAHFFRKWSTASAGAELASGMREGPSGILVFRDVPTGVPLQFRFGGNYPWTTLAPDASELKKMLGLAIRHDDILQVDLLKSIGLTTSLGDADQLTGAQDDWMLSCDEVDEILENKAVVTAMGNANLRPEDVLMAFGQLNILGDARLRMSHLLTACARLTEEQIGIDVARAKSLIRRLMEDVRNTTETTEGCEKSLQEICRSLRDIKFVDELEQQHDEPVPSAHRAAVEGPTTKGQKRGLSAGEPHAQQSSLGVGEVDVPTANAMLATKMTKLRSFIKHKLEINNMANCDIGRERKQSEAVATMTRDRAEHYEDTASVCSAGESFE